MSKQHSRTSQNYQGVETNNSWAPVWRFLFILMTIWWLLAIFSCPCKAQTPQSKPDSVTVVLTDSTDFISIKDLTPFFKHLNDDFSKSQYDKMTPDVVLNELVNWAVAEWNKRKKKK